MDLFSDLVKIKSKREERNDIFRQQFKDTLKNKKDRLEDFNIYLKELTCNFAKLENIHGKMYKFKFYTCKTKSCIYIYEGESKVQEVPVNCGPDIAEIRARINIALRKIIHKELNGTYKLPEEGGE